jgi:multidrug efflux pump subunit AcrA (membrane-fusion protein)
VAGLEAALAAREAQLAQAHEAQRAAAAMFSSRGRGRPDNDGGAAALAELRGQVEAEQRARVAEVAALAAQLSEAQALAQYSAGEMAGLVQQLAEAQGERGEVAAKLAEAWEEVARLRTGAACRQGWFHCWRGLGWAGVAGGFAQVVGELWGRGQPALARRVGAARAALLSAAFSNPALLTPCPQLHRLQNMAA